MSSAKRWLSIPLACALIAAACTNSAQGDDPTTTADSAATSGDSSSTNGGDSSSGGNAGFTAPIVDDTQIELDSDIKTGVLDNGLTYYVLSNDSPGGSVSFRLAVKAGGIHEDPQGTGIAHFLEHMLFNGTTKYPGNELDAVLRGIGAEIGPDSNAYTSATETVYQLAVQDEGNNVETAVEILVEWASEAILDPAEVAAEAPIVREELRQRESGSGLVDSAFDELYHRATPYADVSVSGTPETIEATTPEVLRSYYDNWYRPDNMAVVIVGDRGTNDLEKLVKDNFSDLTARGLSPDPALPEFIVNSEPIVDVIIEPSYGDASVSVDIPLTGWDYGTVGGQQQWVTEILLGVMIDARISEGVQTGRLDLQRGGGQWFGYDRGLQFMGFNVGAEDLGLGAEVLLTELESTIETGFSQAELDRAIDVWRNIQEQRLLGENDISDGEWASNILEDFLASGDLQSIEDSVEMNIDILDSLNIDEVNNHWGWMMTLGGPIIATIGPDAETVGDPADLLAALQRARDAEASSFDDDIEQIDQLMERPDEVREASLTDLTELNGFEAEFANGMRVLFSSSTIDENNVTVLTDSPGGKSQLGVDDAALASTAVNMVGASGFDSYSPIQMSRYLSSTDAGVSPYIEDFSEGFFGGSPANELEIVFQLMHLAITEPAIGDVQFDQQLEVQRDSLEFTSLDSAQAATVALNNARGGGGQFAVQPTTAQLDSFSADQALDIYSDRFSALDEHVILIIGDVNERTVLDLARSYIGTLPTPQADSVGDGLPAPGPIDLSTNAGSGTSAGAYRLLNSGVLDETVQNRVLAEVADSLLNDRLFSVIREELGATYGGNAFITFNEPGDSADLVLSINGDPTRIDEIAAAVDSELAALASGQIDSRDFSEAVTVVRGRYNFISNGFILETMIDEASGAQAITRERQLSALDRITIESLAAFIDSFLNGPDRIEVKNVPG